MRRLLFVSMFWLLARSAYAQGELAAPPRLTLDQYEGQLRWRLAALEQQEDDMRDAMDYGRRRFRIVGGFVGGGISGLCAFATAIAIIAMNARVEEYDENGERYPDSGQRAGLGAYVAEGMFLAGFFAGFTVAIHTIKQPAPLLVPIADTKRARIETLRELKRVERERRQLGLSFAPSGLRLTF